MRTERSYGIIALKHSFEGWEVLLVQTHQGWWGIPKGHADPGEDAKQAALRELSEETGLTVKRFLSEQFFEERYRFSHAQQLINKTVTYYVAEVEGMVMASARRAYGLSVGTS